MRGNQGLDERHPGFVRREDIAGEADRDLGFRDRLQHRRIGFIAVAHRRDRVAGQGRTMREDADRPFQGRILLAAQGADRRRRRPAGGIAAADPVGTPPDPVDAEHPVERRADDGREPGQAHPADRGGDVALVKQDMDRDQDREAHMQGGHDQGAEGIPEMRNRPETD